MKLDLSTVHEVQAVIEKEMNDKIITLEQRLHDAKKDEWFSQAAVLKEACYEARNLRHVVMVAMHSLWMQAADDTFPAVTLKVEKVEALTSPADVELPEIPSKARTLTVVPSRDQG